MVYSDQRAVTVSVVDVADPIAVHHNRRPLLRAFGGTTSSPPGSHVQMIPLPADEAIDACLRNVAGTVGAVPQPVITVAPNAAGAAGSSATPTTCVPVVGVLPGRPIPNEIDVEDPEAQNTSSSFSFSRGVVAAPGWQSSIRTPVAVTAADALEMP